MEDRDERWTLWFSKLAEWNLLGFHFFGNVVAGVSKLNNWELFILDPVDGGYRFMTPYYWMWSDGFIVRPSLRDYLQNSSDGGYYSPIEIEYVDG